MKPRPRPLLTGTQASNLLDAVHERVRGYGDFVAIHAFECEPAQLLDVLVPPTPIGRADGYGAWSAGPEPNFRRRRVQGLEQHREGAARN